MADVPGNKYALKEGWKTEEERTRGSNRRRIYAPEGSRSARDRSKRFARLDSARRNRGKKRRTGKNASVRLLTREQEKQREPSFDEPFNETSLLSLMDKPT